MTDIAPEFSRTLPWGAVSRKEKREELEATEAERAALAARFGILEVSSLRASLRLRQEAGGAARVRGHLTADVVQACVVTLEPVPQHIEEPVDLRFLPEGAEPEDEPDGPDEILTEGRCWNWARRSPSSFPWRSTLTPACPAPSWNCRRKRKRRSRRKNPPGPTPLPSWPP
ncbi:YceD family protein [Pseudoroseomonas wenyumeiae]